MKPAFRTVLLLSVAFLGRGQMTPDQKRLDFSYLAGDFAKRYAMHEWKNQLFGVDLFNIGTFLDNAANSANDLDYYETCFDYVAQFRDAHITYQLPSDFYAYLNFDVDIYDGKVVIEAIDRSVLPSRLFPFTVGDEVVAVDGQPVAVLIRSYAKYNTGGGPRTIDRLAAYNITFRPQVIFPHAPDVPATSSVAVRRQSGALAAYDVPWTRYGLPLLSQGPVPSPHARRKVTAAIPYRPPIFHPQPSTPEAESPAPPYLAGVHNFLHERVYSHKEVAGFGSLRPIFNMPANFQQRLGTNPMTDEFFSGTYQSGGKTLGFIRIPSYEPNDITTALQQLDREIAYFQANTDGLIVDDMRNPGGYGDYALEYARRFIPRTFRALGYQVRATAEMVMAFDSFYQLALDYGAPANVRNALAFFLQQVRTAYSENRGVTGPLPLDNLFNNPFVPDFLTTPASTSGGRITAYSKPIMVLVDDMSFSAADMFAALMQDNQAAQLFGYRTAGAGAAVGSYDAGAYSEALISLPVAQMVRSRDVMAPGYPVTAFVENVGVWPDVTEDYMTVDNLLNRGKTFVQDFSGAMVSYIASQQPPAQ